MARGQRPDRDRTRAGGVPPAEPPQRVRVPVNVHDWEHISFLHWPVTATALASLVPPELDLLTHEGTPWVGITPFRIRVRPPRLPAVPGLSTFPETNVRTYVTGPDGREGVWFLHMEVTKAWFVAALRAFGLPYVQRRMAVDVSARRMSYRSGQRGDDAGSRIVVRPGAPLDPPAGGARERFLTARWGAYHRRGPLMLYTPVEHPPWPLHAAEIADCDVAALFAGAGGAPPRPRRRNQQRPSRMMR
jgi:uncharacterized protein